MVGRILSFVALVALACAGSSARGQNETPFDPSVADSQLNDLALVGGELGWAVGDRGAIWHTSDGGRHWRLQNSGVDCRLTAVEFVDARHGWAAGGYARPYTRTTCGVLLETRDGGEHWQADRNLLLPALDEIKFFDSHRGWAVGQPSALFPCSVFTTEDGGRSWSSLPADDGQAWLTGDFSDPQNGLLAGRRGALAAVRKRALLVPPDVQCGLRAIQRARIAGGDEAWLAGDGGLALRSSDRGETWNTPAGALPTAEFFDFQALCARGERCWIAGSPGTRVFHSADGGRTWQAFATGQALPLRAIEFADDRQGWAVGELGLILATSDGGHTWQRQRGGGTRAGLLAVCATAGDVPLELIARLSADEGYLAAVDVLMRQDLDAQRSPSADASAAAHEAVVRAGGSAAHVAWQFPVREPGLRLAGEALTARWQGAGEGRAFDEFDAYLIRRLRTWRPAVVFIPPLGRQADPQSQLLAQAVLQAVERAADPEQRPEQIRDAGLQPWTVEKVFAALPSGETGTLTLSTAQLSARSGRSLADLAATARGASGGTYQPAPAALGFRLAVDHLPQDRGTRDFFSGISLATGEGRRALTPVSEESLDRLRRASQTRRNLQAILAQAERPNVQAGRWLAEVGETTRTLDDASASEVLFQLAQRYYREGRWPLAAEAFEMIASRYPRQPLAGAALVWLVQYYSSAEGAWRAGKTEQIQARQIVAVEPPGGRRRGQRIGATPPAGELRQGAAAIGSLTQPDDRLARAAAFGKQLEQIAAGLEADPEVRFPLALSQARQGADRQAERILLALRRTRQNDTWAACAAGEVWLTKRQGAAPKPSTVCPLAETRPRLDGKLDDPLWRAAPAIELQSASRDDAAWSTAVMLARDERFLYWAASCRRPPGRVPAPAQRNREHDAQLDAQDRVELCIDVDRDATTYYRLSVDERGCTRDECWHDASWNPGWFVAAARDDEGWTLEAAVPLAELAPSAPGEGQAWAIGLTRVVPGLGLQSWTKPAGVEPVGSGFGYLLFE